MGPEAINGLPSRFINEIPEKSLEKLVLALQLQGSLYMVSETKMD